jgi:lipid II:glycine glycyltransferase (peptidoglycan interpeptide bridge formation enzyme)
VLPLEDGEEAQWKAIGAKVRNQTRKAEREGLRIAEGDADQLVGQFYQPFATNMRDLGSPVHAEGFYRAAAQHFGERLRFIVVCDDQRPVGGLVAIRYASCVTVTWASTLRSERRRCPNNLIYWEALRWAIGQGASSFDFGRSRLDAGTYRFKRGWGAEDRPLAWVRLNSAGDPLPIGSTDDNSALQRLSAIWSHLPVPVSVFLGPRVRRFLSN